ncbi:MAG: tetratricopeptide repeat protein [Vampirovibrionales bacterium]|nr:tetratricopeptide repeat protein [Vampirovibrionales bacterium]
MRFSLFCPSASRVCAWMLRVSLMLVMAAWINIAAPTAVYAQNVDAARLYNQALDRVGKGDTPGGISLFEQAAAADPNYADSFYNLGTLYFKQRQYAQATTAFQRTLQLNPGDQQARFSLALSYEQQSRFAEAAETLRQIPPNDSHYGTAQTKIPQLEAALKTWRPQTQASAQKPPAAKTPAKVGLERFAQGFFGPTGLAMGRDGSLFVANYSKNQIFRIAPDGAKSVFTQSDLLKGPVGLVYNSALNEFYVANYLGANIVRISADGRASVMVSGLKKPYYLLLDSPHNQLYVSEQDTNTVTRIRLGG